MFGLLISANSFLYLLLGTIISEVLVVLVCDRHIAADLLSVFIYILPFVNSFVNLLQVNFLPLGFQAITILFYYIQLCDNN